MSGSLWPHGLQHARLLVLHYLPEFAQIHIHWVGGAIQPPHPLLPPSPSSLNLSQHQNPFQWVSSSDQVAKVLELQLQHQSFQWISLCWVKTQVIWMQTGQARDHLHGNDKRFQHPFHLGEGCCNLHSPLDCQINCSQMVSLKMWPAAMLGSWMCDSHSLAE